MKKRLKNRLRESLLLISEGLTQSVDSEMLITKITAMGIDSDDVYFNDGYVRLEVKPKYKEIITNVINRVENLLGWFVSGYQEDFHEPIETNIGEIKNDLQYNLQTMEDEGYDSDDVVFYLLFEPKFGQELSPNEIPNIVYHITDQNNLNGILAQGLKPTHRDKITFHPDRIYLLTSENNVSELIDNPSFNIENPVLLTLDISSIKQSQKFYVDPNLSDNGVYTINNIPPTLIKNYKNI